MHDFDTSIPNPVPTDDSVSEHSEDFIPTIEENDALVHISTVILNTEEESSTGLPWDSITADAPDTTPIKKTGSIFIPILLTVAVFLFGLSTYLLDVLVWSKVPVPAESELSAGQTETEAAPADYLSIENGVLCFLPDAFPGGVIKVPASISGIPVTSIPDNCFRGCSTVTMIIVDSGITTIGNNAFSMCKKLRGVAIPSSVVTIGESVFRDDKSLEAVLVSSGCESIGSNAFNGCDHLHYIFYPGTHEKWKQLYTEQINPFAYISCYDGYFPQSGN